MGAGKSSVARVLGELLGSPVADLDLMLEAGAGCSIAELFERHGEAAFRRAEVGLLGRALASGAGVLACGGGIVLDPESRSMLLTRCRAVWLEVSPAEAARRVAPDPGARPLLRSGPARERLEALLRERAAYYAEVAMARVATDNLSGREVATAVLEALKAGAR